MRPDESNEENALRKLEEDLGIKKEQSDLMFIGQEFYTDQKTSVWGNVYHVKLGDEGRGVKLRPEDAVEVTYRTQEQILQFIDEQSKSGYKEAKATPDSVKMFRYFVDN